MSRGSTRQVCEDGTLLLVVQTQRKKSRIEFFFLGDAIVSSLSGDMLFMSP